MLRSLAIKEKGSGMESAFHRTPLLILGRCELELGAPERAREALERAYADKTQTDPLLVAQIEFALARALVDSRADRSRALSLARSARAKFEADGRMPADHAALKAWLKKNFGRR